MNQVILSGIIAADPDLRYTQNGTAILKVRLAGTTEERPHYFDATFIGERAEKLADQLKKGMAVLVQGELSQRQVEGKTYTSILARMVRSIPNPVRQEDREAGSLNRFTGIGFLAADPEEHTVASKDGRTELTVVRARVAFRRRAKEGDQPVFLNVVAWEEYASPLKGLKKGDQVYVEGLLKARKWSRQDGTNGLEIFVSARVVKALAWAGTGAKQAEDAQAELPTVEEEFPLPEDLPF